MFAARQLTAVMLSRMEGLVGSVDLDIYELSGEGLDLRDVWNVQQLRGCLGALAVAQLLPAFSGFLLAFLQLYVLLQLASNRPGHLKPKNRNRTRTEPNRPNFRSIRFLVFGFGS